MATNETSPKKSPAANVFTMLPSTSAAAEPLSRKYIAVPMVFCWMMASPAGKGHTRIFAIALSRMCTGICAHSPLSTGAICISAMARAAPAARLPRDGAPPLRLTSCFVWMTACSL